MFMYSRKPCAETNDRREIVTSQTLTADMDEKPNIAFIGQTLFFLSDWQ